MSSKEPEFESVPFSAFFYLAYLSQTDWPRSQGLLRRRFVVPPSVIDTALDRLWLVGKAAGAGDRALGARLLAGSFDGEWEEQRIDGFVRELEAVAQDIAAYRSLAQPDDLDWEFVTGSDFLSFVVSSFCWHVWYGMNHSAEVIAEVDGDDAVSEADRMFDSFDEQFAEVRTLVQGYEAKFGALPDAPTPLLDRAAA